MQLPVIPAFVANETSIPHLQQLSAAVQFATVAQYYPMWRFYKTATLNILASTLTTVAFGQVAIDTDGVWSSPGSVVINTQGYYECEASVPFEGNSSGVNDLQLSMLFTAGPYNAHFSAGTTQRFGGAAGSAAVNSGPDWVLCTADICPVVLYPGDQISVVAFTNFATTTNILVNLSTNSGWFPPQFSGRWIRTGS